MPTQCIYAFYMDLRTNSDYFPTQQQPCCVCKETGSSLYRRTFFFGGGGVIQTNIRLHRCLAIAQAVSCRSLTEEARVRF